MPTSRYRIPKRAVPQQLPSAPPLVRARTPRDEILIDIFSDFAEATLGLVECHVPSLKKRKANCAS